MAGTNIDYLKRRIVDTMSVLYDRGYLSSVGGNISCRAGEIILITPSGKTKFLITPDDIAEVSLDGKALNKVKPSSELPVHLVIYKSRGDVNCVIHAHPVFTIIASMMFNESFFQGTKITPESAVYTGRVKVISYRSPGQEAAEEIEKIIGHSDIIVVKNHGVFSTGRDIDEALARLEVLEENSKLIYYLSLMSVGFDASLAQKVISEKYALPGEEVDKLLKIYKK